MHTIALLFALFAVPLAAGLVAAKGNDPAGLHRRFFRGLGIAAAWAALCLGFAALSHFNIAGQLGQVLPPRLPVPDYYSFTMPELPEKFPASWYWNLYLVLFLAALMFYPVAFVCRKRTESCGQAWIGILGFGLVFAICGPWGFYGIGAFLQLFREISDTAPVWAALWTLLLPTAALLAVWTGSAFKSKKKRSWKYLLGTAGILAGIYAAVWILSLGVAELYGMHVAGQLKKHNPVPAREESQLPANLKKADETIDRFLKGHEDFSLPLDGSYFWTVNGAKKNGSPAPEKVRVYTKKWADTPEFERYRKAEKAIMERVLDPSVLNFSCLNTTRSYTRLCLGKAALYRETGAPDKILPELQKAAAVDTETLKDTRFLIGEPIRSGIRFFRCSGIVSIGPDGPQYAPAYRKMLEQMKSEEVRIPQEYGFYLTLLEDALHLRYRPCDRPGHVIGSYENFLCTPALIAVMASQSRCLLNREDAVRKLKQREIFKTAPGFAPFPDESNPVRKYQKTVAVVSRASIAEGTTALALKLYRSEKGHYPKTLDALVPDYLDRIPPCPFNGKPFEYQSDGKSFELGIVTPSPALREHYRISSKPEY